MKKTEELMRHSIESLKKEFQGLRTGRASAHLLDAVRVEAYGSHMPIAQVGTVSVPESRMITVQVWDAGLVKATEKAIAEAGLGLNPSAEGNVIRINIPQLTEDRRKDLIKVAGKYAEQARVSIRNARRAEMDSLKVQEKEGDISEDEHHTQSTAVQKMTDKYIDQVDELLKTKETEISQV